MTQRRTRTTEDEARKAADSILRNGGEVTTEALAAKLGIGAARCAEWLRRLRWEPKGSNRATWTPPPKDT